MLSSETVFVVGAGASRELNLPLGDELKSQIANLLDIRFDDRGNIIGDYQIATILRELASERNYPSINPLLHKCWLIRDALPGSISIDNLLDAHRNDREVAEIGKLAIAKSILSAERGSLLYKDPRKDQHPALSDAAGTWLIPLFQILSEGIAKEEAAKIFDHATFVVFNYDRTLEFFLITAIEKYYGLERAQAEELVSHARIIHPYGRVGEFGQGKSLASARYGSEHYTLRRIADGIRTFSEGIADQNNADDIKVIVQQADQIVFLGFAFHPLNMAILEAAERSLVTKVFGTTIGLSDAAVRSVQHSIFDVLKNRLSSGMGGIGDMDAVREVNLEEKSAEEFLFAHFRGLT